MDPHLLRTFVAVVDQGSFSEAARELGYTQSAVSQHIATLERDVGAVLLHRRPVAPTGVGIRLLEHARPLLLRWDAARADMARMTAAPATRMVIGVTPLAMTAPFGSTLTDLRLTRPHLAVTIRVLGRAALLRDVATAAVDLGLVDGMAAPTDPLHLPDAGPLTTTALSERPLAVALPASHPLAGRTGLSLTDLADARWIDAPDTAIPLAHLRAVSGTDGYRPALCYEGSDVRGLTTLIAADHGLALLPQRALDDQPGIHAVPLNTPRLVHRTEALYQALPDSPAALLASALAADA
ncbi:LysR family transcriptional regulator [Streptomyces caniferus]|uniref:LysR family transcriptional regulator n=1 Tax=Streptomyces caniferus TaxID=285557 RepID=A0A640S8T7_9ACTN|nr:LysR family transcriptional regulator [Streptomyces caniferus]GFE07477.1 LysR family transcriptional regulator [Streptomyces caniferus]